jgi:hypothetical protein
MIIRTSGIRAGLMPCPAISDTGIHSNEIINAILLILTAFLPARI